jgi:hypothetical protein
MKTSNFLRGGRGLLLGMLAVALLPTVALAAGEQYGRVAGYIFDSEGNPLAEIPVTVSGPASPQPQTAVSGKDGRYEISTVLPGDGYTASVDTAGFKKQKVTELNVLLGSTTTADFALEVVGESDNSETITLVGKANPALDPDTARTGAIMSGDKAYNTPIFSQVQALPQLVAGVGPGNAPSTRGGLQRWGKQYVDGMETTDTTDGSISAPLNYLAIESAEITTGGFDAQYNSLGLVQNVITKSGSNRFTYDVMAILQPAWAGMGTTFASRQPAGVGGLLNNTTPQAETTFYSPFLNVGGPIVKDRLWFYASTQLNLSHRETPLDNENRPKDTETRIGRLKLTWQPSGSDRFSLALNLDRNTITNNLSNVNTALEAEQYIKRGGYFLIGNYDRTISDNARLELQTGVTWKDSNTGPMAGAFGIAQVDTNNSFFTQGGMQRISSTNEGNFLIERKVRYQFDPTLHWRLGSHNIKGGAQLGLMTGTERTGVYGGERFLNRGPVCDPTNLAVNCYQLQRFYNEDGVLADSVANAQTNDASVYTGGLFLQDRWNVNRQLTLTGGLRFDQGRLYGDNGKYLGRLQGFGPRLSASYDLLGDRSTLVKAYYGRSNDVGDLFIAQQGNPQLRILTATVQGSGNTPRTLPECELGVNATGCASAGGASGIQLMRGQKAPYVDEVQLGVHREVASGMVLGVDGTYRRYANLWVDEEINRVWDATGTRIVGYANGVAEDIVQQRTTNRAWRDYKGMDLWLQGRTGGFDVLASYTLGFNNGTVGSYFDGFGDNRQLQYLFEGPMPEDIRHNFKGSVQYEFGFGLQLGTRLQLRTGAPMWQNTAHPVGGGQRLYRSPRGTGYTLNTAGQPDVNNPNALVELRQPDQFILDLNARYDVGRALRLQEHRAELLLNVYNALNSQAAWNISDQYARSNSTFGQVLSRQSPLAAQLSVRFRN